MEKHFVIVTIADGTNIVGLIEPRFLPNQHSTSLCVKIEEPRALRVIPVSEKSSRAVLTPIFPTESSQKELFLMPIVLEHLGDVVGAEFVELDPMSENKQMYDSYKESIRQWKMQTSRIAQPSGDEVKAIMGKKLNLHLVDK